MRESSRRIVRLLLLTAFLGGGSPALAQDPPDDERAEPCDPATQPCEEQAPDTEEETGLEAAVEEDADIEASAEEEFTPGDEISEDYPVPLPSDI